MRDPDFSNRILTAITDLFFGWILFYYGMGGWDSAVTLLTQFGFIPWIILGAVLFLVIYRSDWRTDIPLFIAGWALGYWGEWWGTTRGVWTYWDGASPPAYLPPLWGIGLLTVYRLGTYFKPLIHGDLPHCMQCAMRGSFLILPLAAFAVSWQRLEAIDWHGRIDLHFAAGMLVAATLILYRFDLQQDFALFISGTLLGGLYEYLGTSSGEWTYITGEIPPIWIAPLWGIATVAMAKLASLLRLMWKRLWGERFTGQQMSQRR